MEGKSVLQAVTIIYILRTTLQSSRLRPCDMMDAALLSLVHASE